MIVSKILLNDLITNHLKQEKELNEVLEFTLNAMLIHERELHPEGVETNKGSGFRPVRLYGHGKLLELHIRHEHRGVLSEGFSPTSQPADRYGNA